MNKIKMNPGLAAVILLISLFSGWKLLLISLVLIFVLCEVDDKVKGIAVSVLAFYGAYLLIDVTWGLIVSGETLIYNDFRALMVTFANWFDTTINVNSIYQYFLTPVHSLVSIADSIVNYLLAVSKVLFVFAVLANKPMKQNFFVNKINEFITKIVNYINFIDTPVQAADKNQKKQ